MTILTPMKCGINTQRQTHQNSTNSKSVRKSDPPPLHITHPFLTPTLGMPLYGLLHIFTKQSWATSSIIFQKSQLPLYIRKRGFTIRSSPRQRKFTHSPRPHFSKYVTPTNWKEGEGTRKTAKSNQCSCGEIKSNIRFVLHVSSLILDKLYIVLETVFSKLKLFNIKQSLVEKSYIMARSRTLL